MPVEHLTHVDADGGVAARLRSARRITARTLRCVADGAGTSESMLSKLENGKAQPSIGTLRRLASALGRPTSWFFGADDGPVVVSDAATRARLRAARGDEVEPVVALGTVSAAVVHLVAGEAPWTPPDHDGEAFAMVLDGDVVLLTTGGAAPMRPGDAVACGGSSARSLHAVGGPARVLLVDARTPSIAASTPDRPASSVG